MKQKNRPHPAFPKIFAGGMHEVNRLARQRNHRLGDSRVLADFWEQAPCGTTFRLRQFKSGRAPSLDRPDKIKHWPARGTRLRVGYYEPLRLPAKPKDGY